jgi:hypothetical protein
MFGNLIGSFYKKLHSDASLNFSEKRDVKIIVSMTTIPPRISKIHQVILRLLKQTIKADKIIIYLGKDKFKGVSLPFMLQLQMKFFGVEVRYVEDIGPHTKYFYAITEFPNDIVITTDDDIKYTYDLFEELYSSYKRHPKAVSARRCHLMTFDEHGKIKKYNEWLYKYSDLIDTPSMKLFPTGVGGVLYPPKCLHSEVYNLENIKKLTLKNDDVWLKFMEVLNNTPVVMTKPFVIKHVKGSQKVALNQENVRGQGNDVLIANVISAYNDFLGPGSMIKRIMSEE